MGRWPAPGGVCATASARAGNRDRGQNIAGVFVVAYQLTEVVGDALGGLGGGIVANVYGFDGSQKHGRVGAVEFHFP